MTNPLKYNLVKVVCIFEGESENAIFIKDKFGDKHTLPKSQLMPPINGVRGKKITLKMTRWIAEKEDLSYVSTV